MLIDSGTDVNRHLQTFRRHKVGLLLPIIIALVIATSYATSRPHKYESYTTLWFDTQAPGASSLVNPGNTTPAAQGMAVLQEFLGTEQFLVNVGVHSSLPTYVATPHPAKKGLLSKLTSLVHGSSAGTSPRPSAQDIDQEMVGILQNAFTVSTTGPQMVRVTMTSTNPSYMTSALAAVATEYVAAINQDLNNRNVAANGYYASQIDAAQQALTNANAALLQYQQAHPAALPTTDPRLNQLTQTAFQAQTAYATLKTSFQQSTVSVQSADAAAAFHVVDPPRIVVELSSKKHMIFTVVAGLMAGLVISLLALSGLTSLDKTARRREDIDGVSGMEVVASIRQLPRGKRLPVLARTKSS